MGYYFVIQKENRKFFFKLIPGNNGSQEIGASIGYDNYCVAKKHLNILKSM